MCGYNPILLHFLVQLSSLWLLAAILPSRKGSAQVCVVYALPSPTRCCGFIVYISCLGPKTSHFPRELWLLFWRMVFNTEIWPPGVRIATEVSLLLGHLRQQSEEMHVRVITRCIHISVNISTSNLLCLC